MTGTDDPRPDVSQRPHSNATASPAKTSVASHSKPKQPRKPASNTSRWAAPSSSDTLPLLDTSSAKPVPPDQAAAASTPTLERPQPHPISRTSSHSASASRQPKGPPSPSPSQSGTPRSASHSGQRRTTASTGGGGTSTSRWATQPSSPNSLSIKGNHQGSTLDENVSQKSTPLSPTLQKPVPSSPVTVSPARTNAETTEPINEDVQLPPPVPTVAASATQSRQGREEQVPSSFSTTKPPAPRATRSVPPPHNESQPRSQLRAQPSTRSSPRTQSTTSHPSPSPSPQSQSQNQLKPIAPPSATSKSPLVGVGAGSTTATTATMNPMRNLLPDRNRVSTGGAKKEKKSAEELEALMEKMRLKNEEAMKKRLKAEEDRKKFEEIAEMERKKREELERKQREERERVIREEKERKERTLELQKEINRAREEAAQRKLALIQGRAWDAEKLARERDPQGEGGSGRELQYPSHERKVRTAEQQLEPAEDVEDHEREGGVEGPGGRPGGGEELGILTEEERRRRDGVRNDEQAWETVQHFEGKGRAQLVVK